jgi:tetratricopeptide (TPR) repeat protein
MRTKVTIWVALLLLATWATTACAKSAAVQLQEGLYAEQVEGNLDAAIKIYQKVIDDKNAPAEQVAQALYHQGMCYMKKKSDQEAKAVFARILTEHSDQTDLVAKVKPLLEELGNADPAALMPPETLMYVEIGSPGKQVQTILNMLKGTPLENPLAVIGNANQGQAAQSGQPNPANIIGALLNPSMMAEFEKVRGAGIGITGIAQEGQPPALIVLYPGKSDALRGLLQMVLGVAGQPAESIEGMRTVALPSGSGAAYDDTVVIIAGGPDAAERLKWSVRQYKGLSNEPTLASSNKSFAKIDKKTREQNAVTLWVNLDEAYQALCKVVPQDKMPQQMWMANGFVDFNNIDDLIASLSLHETGIAVEANVNFKNGHTCMAYNLIRTPHLNRALLKAVPPEAVALVAVALGEAETPQEQAASQQIKSITGLDIGREIFANIQQVTLFAVPTQKTATEQLGPAPWAAYCFGLVITSDNPQQTQQVLAMILKAANAAGAGAQPAEIPASGRFEMSLGENMKLLGYTNPANNTMILSLNPDVINASVAAAARRSPTTAAGLFQESLNSLPPATSKLVLVNVGGILRFAAAGNRMEDEKANETVQNAFAQLAQACEKTTVEFRTAEEINSLDVRLEISDLPKADQMFGPISDLVSTFQSMNRGNWSNEEEIPMQMPVNLTKAPAKPSIDGKIDDVWAAAKSYELKNNLYKPVTGPADCSASFKTLYDADNLYILVDVNDDVLKHDSSEFYDDDCVEIFFDADNSRSGSYDNDDHSYYFVWDAASPIMGKDRQPAKDGTQFAFTKTDKGYCFEVQFAWKTLGVKPSPGTMFGLDVHVDDDDDGGSRDSKLTWNGQTDDAWQNPRVFGVAQIPGMVGWWKLDEKEGRTAADSSGNDHAATVEGNPEWQPSAGKIGGAIALSGNGDFLDVADEASFDCIGAVTLAVWIKADALDKPWQAIVTKGDHAYRLQRNNETDTVEFACTGLHVANENQYGSLFGSEEITLNEWRHVAGVYDGQKMYIYMDGVLDASQEATGTIHTNDVRLQIGANTEAGDRFWHGLIDDVRVYNYAISAAEIAKLADAT